MDTGNARELPSWLAKNSQKSLSAGVAMDDNLNPHHPFDLAHGDSLAGLTGYHAETPAASYTTLERCRQFDLLALVDSSMEYKNLLAF
jgi:hypothetical protein